MLGNIISQLYRIADLLKTKKLVDIDSNTDSNSSEDKPKELTLDDIYQYYKNELLSTDDFSEDFIQSLPQTFDDIELIENINDISRDGIYKNYDSLYQVLFSYIDDNDTRCYVSYLIAFDEGDG